MATNFGVNPKLTLMGSQSCLPHMSKVWAEASGRILGTVLGMDQHSNTALPV